jgi:hypothetical protein
MSIFRCAHPGVSLCRQRPKFFASDTGTMR